MLRRLLFSAAGGSLVVLACSSSTGSARSESQRANHSETDGGAYGAVTIHFEVPLNGQLNEGVGYDFNSGTPQEVTVQVDPPGLYMVSFSLGGDAADAFLDKSQATTNSNGKTSVRLTPPSSAHKFSLRASIGDVWSELPVKSTTGTTTLDVVPVYAGKRAVSVWFAGVGVGLPCDPTLAVQPDGSDGAFSQAMDGPSVPVPNVPVGVPLRVTLRAGHFAGGCTQVPAFQAGERPSVSVTVTDLPLQLNGVKIPVVLGLDDSGAFAAAWSKLASTMTASAVASNPSDAGALLDTIQASIPYLSQDAFALARTVHGWDARVNGLLASGPGATGIRDTLTRWIVGGRKGLSTQVVSGTLTSPDSGSGTASFAVTSIASAAPSDVGFPSTLSLTWTSAPSDQVLFGATASWEPSRLAAVVAQAAATQEVDSASDVADALASVISCDGIAAALAHDAAEVPFLSCDADCLSSRCESALASMWKKARDAVLTRATVHIAATGTAVVDDTAHPTGFSGTWVGDGSFGSGTTTLGGSANGAASSDPPR
jgi:hypothetical protein